MKRIGIIFLGALAFGIVGMPGSLLAHATHAGEHAASPFDAAKGKKSPHCLLQGHHHKTLPYCPHTQRIRTGQPEFKADCNNPLNGTPVHIQWTKILVLSASVENDFLSLKQYCSAPRPNLLPSSLPVLPDKPPQLA